MAKKDSLGGTFSTFMEQLETDIQKKLDAVIDRRQSEWETALAGMRKELDTSTSHVTIQVRDSEHTISGLRHKQLPSLITIAAQRLSVFMVGSAGSGKSTAAEQVADGLGLPFFAMSVGSQTSKSDIIGYMNATGDYVRSLFREAYEHGGVFLLDEADAGNANVLVQINAALANNYCAFPDGMVKRHDDFILIASGNTYGNGANRQYVGRTQLDAATLDRFVILDWEIDEDLEAQVAGDDSTATRWHNAIKALRKDVSDEGMRVLVTPRATYRGAVLFATGLSYDEVCDLAVLRMFPADKTEWAKAILDNEWGV